MHADREAFLELLKSQHHFPGLYTMKFIGLAEDSFVERVVAAVRTALGNVSDPPFTTRSSRNDKHVSVTLQPLVCNAEQVLDVYEQVRDVRGLQVSL